MLLHDQKVHANIVLEICRLRPHKGHKCLLFCFQRTTVWFCQIPGKSAAGVTENAAINKVQQVNWALLSQPNFLIAVEVTQQKLPEINTTVSRQRPV